jgi:hypothetical protein
MNRLSDFDNRLSHRKSSTVIYPEAAKRAGIPVSARMLIFAANYKRNGSKLRTGACLYFV